MRKLLSASLLAVTLIALCVTSVRTARAAPAPNPTAGGPTVLVAVDATAHSNCQETLHINTGWHTTPPPGAAPLVASTMTIPCPAGTIVKTAEVSLAQALAHQWSYLALSSATPQQIAALVQTQRQALRARLAPASGTQERSAVAPNFTCGWNTSTSTSAVLNGDTVFVEVYYYVARDCSTIILDYSNTWLSSPYYNPMYWETTEYNHRNTPYCYMHACWWGFFYQTLAPPNTAYRRNYNATEQAGHDYEQFFSDTYDPSTPGSSGFSIDLGNLS